MATKEKILDKIRNGDKFKLTYMGTVEDLTKTSINEGIERVEEFLTGKVENRIRIWEGQKPPRWHIA